MKKNETDSIIKSVDDIIEKIDTLMYMIRKFHTGLDTTRYMKGGSMLLTVSLNSILENATMCDYVSC